MEGCHHYTNQMTTNLKTALIVLSLAVGASHAAMHASVGDVHSFTINLQKKHAKGGKLAAKTIRLTAVSDDIVRVEATPDDTFPQVRQSLVVVPQAQQATFGVAESRRAVTLTTARLRVVADKRTGRLEFFDRLTGRSLLRQADRAAEFSRYVSAQTELPQGYAPSAPDEVGWGKSTGANLLSLADRSGYTWRTVFEGQEGESIYGLGQHQSEEMDYRGRDEELFQYNTKVSVPFVVSTCGYGLLWDSYSLCRWGNPCPYRQLGQVLNLRDKHGAPGALTGTYTDGKGRATVERREDSLYYEHSGVVGNLPRGLALDGANVVYEGTIEARQTATMRFILYYAGYVRVYIGDSLVVPERWRTAWNPNAYKFAFSMKKGRRYPLRVEWRPDGSTSYCGLRVAEPRGEAEQRRLSIWSEMAKKMDYYFIAGGSMDEVVAGYRRLTGKAQVMPRWALGFWQSRERYKTSDDVVSTLREFRQRRIPIDNIVQDWNYWEDDQWGSHRFDPKRYPSPQAMLDSVHAMNGRFMVSVWPKFYCNTANYKALDSIGAMYRRAVADSIRDWVGPGYVGSFYDAYSLAARKLFWRQMDDCLYSRFNGQIDAWWMDASEPNVRDCTPIDYRKALCGPTALGTSDEYFNAYSVVNADAIYNGQRAVSPDKRVFLLTRSGFAGLQRYSTATWSGDIGTRWEDMRAQMTAGLNFSMAGVPWWGMDIGGFCVEKRYADAQKLFDKTGQENADLDEWRELQARWHQFGCFVPLYRTHGQWPLREVWNIAPGSHPAYQSILFYHKLRYRLMPYLYSMAGWVHFNDYTMMRGLAMDYADDIAVRSIGDQWMFGPSLMACPVGRYKDRSRQVYFPRQCGWYDLYTGRHRPGGQSATVEAPYGRIPVFVPEGGIIPFGPELQWSDEKKADLIYLYIYGGADGKFSLYEDNGTDYGYERGEYATIDIAYDDARRMLSIGRRKGAFSGMLQSRRFRVVLVSPENPQPLSFDNQQGVAVDYCGQPVTVSLAD